MKSFIVALSLGLTAVTYALPSLSQDMPPAGIKVVGKASAAMVPDTFMVRFGFQQRGHSAAKLKQHVDSQTSQLTSLAKSLGVKSDNVTSSQLTVTVRYLKPEEHTKRVYAPQKSALVETTLHSSKEKETEVEFIVSRTVEVVLTELAIYDKLLDSSVKIGATRIDPVQSYVDNNEDTYNKLLQSAVDNAKSKADLLAQQTGAKLGKVLSVEEMSHYQARPRMAVAESRAFHRSQPGSLDLTAEVIVRFAIDH